MPVLEGTPDFVATLRDALADRYVIEKEIGRGGMALVYLVRDVRQNRSVAMKVLRPEFSATLMAQRFFDEIRHASKLQHPGILPIHESGKAADLFYYTMPYVPGNSLRQRLLKERQLSLPDAVRLAREIAEALAYAHAHGIVHRDIKPENILLSDGHAVIADFGIARALDEAGGERLTSSGLLLGTPEYMSPEQCSKGTKVDARSDQYSLGCVVYETLAGEPPFTGSSAQVVISRQMQESPRSLRVIRDTIPEPMEAAIRVALAKVPADRFSGAVEFAKALDDPVWAGPPAGARPRSRKMVAATLVLTILLAVVGIQILSQGRQGPGVPQLRLAVLPFVVVGGSDEAHFAVGLSDEITSRLARLPGVAVIARNNTINYRSQGRTIQQIGRDLGVDYIIDGTVRWTHVGGKPQVRVTPSLVRSTDASQMWSEALDGAVDDVFKLQTLIAERIAERLPIRMPEPAKRALRAPATTNVEAYREYVLGRFHWQKRTREGLEAAADHFNTALGLEPLFARASSGLADCYVLFPQFGVTSLPWDIALARARKAAEQALALDSTLAEAHASLGEVVFYTRWADGDWAEAERHFKNSIAWDPYYATAHQWYAELLAVTGRADSAVAEGRRAALMDPVSGVANHAWAIGLLAARRYDEAIEKYQRVLTLDPGFGYAHMGLAWTSIATGKHDEAVARMARILKDTTFLTRLWVRAAIDSTYRPDARRALAENRATVRRWNPELQAEVYASVGDAPSAVAVLERFVQDRGPQPPGVIPVPLYDPIRRDPRFQAILKRIALPTN